MPNVKDHIFLNAVTAPTKGVFLENKGYEKLTVEIYGTSDSRTINFWQMLASGTLKPLAGIRADIINPALAVSTTGTGEVWQFDNIYSAKRIYFELAAIAGVGANITVAGGAWSNG